MKKKKIKAKLEKTRAKLTKTRSRLKTVMHELEAAQQQLGLRSDGIAGLASDGAATTQVEDTTDTTDLAQHAVH
jgi:hypothetical protein